MQASVPNLPALSTKLIATFDDIFLKMKRVEISNKGAIPKSYISLVNFSAFFG